MSVPSFFIEDLKELTVHVKDTQWKDLGIDLESLTSQILMYVLEHENNNAYEISVSFIDNAAIQQLNFQYRGKNMPTNVLSFVYNEKPVCGDIILAYETIFNEAKEQEKEFQDHLTHLIIHGVLHLLGYDHEIEQEAVIMEALEKQLLKHFNISNPYSGEEKIRVQEN